MWRLYAFNSHVVQSALQEIKTELAEHTATEEGKRESRSSKTSSENKKIEEENIP